MRFHVLIVEDDEDFVEELREAIARLSGDSEIWVAGSRDAAYQTLEDQFLDLVVLDLKIPTVSDALDADPEHGYAVFSRIRTVAPGTPIFVLTGSPAEDFIPDLLNSQEKIDIWGVGKKTGTISFLKKVRIEKLPDLLEPIVQAIVRLSDVEVILDGVTLTLAEDRLIRIFSRRVRGTRCVVSRLNGGLSSAKVIRLQVTDDQGVVIHTAVAKLSDPSGITREGDCYDSYVARLAPGVTPRKIATLEFGAYNLAGVFFGLASGFDKSVFDCACDEFEQSDAIVRRVECAVGPWTDRVPTTMKTIRAIRQRLLDDRSFSDVQGTFGLQWAAEFENRTVPTRWGCTHGDLHGLNILVSPPDVTLIDYSEIGDGAASVDPVTLELSLLFHPDSPGNSEAWPTADQARRWWELEFYLEDCRFSQFVRACRA